jgi:hypothetical protein
MNYPLRVFLFRHYWWLTPLFAALAGWAVVAYSRPENVPGNLVALCAAALGVVYFVQKRKVDDLQIFERLFVKFNERYAAMHSDLQRVATARDEDVCGDRVVLDAYFNLCAEEYLFFQQGRILPCVWRAWCRGMVAFLQNRRVWSYWQAEEGQDSHYELTLRAIYEGAGLPMPGQAPNPDR